MTAQLIQTPLADVRVRPFRPARPTRRSTTRVSPQQSLPARPSAARWPGGSARSCSVARPAVPRGLHPVAPVGDGRLYWTRRGVAVMVAAVLLCVGIMAATLVGAFLAVSDAPLASQTQALVASAPAPARAG